MHAFCSYYSLLFTFLQYIAIKSAKVLFHLLLFVYLPSIQVKGKTHTPLGPTCGRIWHLVMTCCLCKIEMSETQATSFMNEYSMHNAMQYKIRVQELKNQLTVNLRLMKLRLACDKS